jgi:FKBP-type peptidyl-prolyl cis-trans isomerase (trigger factor)
MDKLYDKVDIKKLPDSEVEISVSVKAGKLSSYRTEALEHIKEHTSIPGFRKGKVPEKMVLERVGEMKVLEEATELLIKDVYPQIITNEKLDVIGHPTIELTKLAPNNDIEFKVTVALFPAFEIGNYKKTAKEVLGKQEPVKIAEDEVQKVVDEIRKLQARGDGVEDDKKDLPDRQAGLPELTDEFVKKMGNFENVEDFKKKVLQNITKEKEFRAKEKQRLEIIGKIIERSDIPVPKILVENELNRMFAQFGEDVKRMGSTITEYLQKIKKTEEGLRVEWQADAKTRVKFELILEKIAGLEKIKANDEEVTKEADHIIEHYEGAQPERVRAYVEHQMRNEAVFKFLEEQK